MTNKEVRQWYRNEVGQIPILNQIWITDGLSIEERARRAWRMRREARLKARDLMENPVEVEVLRARDEEVYGNVDGPTFEFLLAKARKLGLKGDKIYAAIIEESLLTNREINERFED